VIQNKSKGLWWMHLDHALLIKKFEFNEKKGFSVSRIRNTLLKKEIQSVMKKEVLVFQE
jgi:hypothetical protein